MPAGVSAYVPLANVTLTSQKTDVIFSGISQSYKDLIVVANIDLSSSNSIALRLNFDSGNNYATAYMAGNGTTIAQTSTGSMSYGIMSNSFTNSGQLIFHIMDYSATNKNKQVITRFNNALTETFMGTTRWNNTAAITSFNLFFVGGSATIGSTFALYGVSA